MAKKGNRIQVILECTEHKTTGVAGTSRYITTKNKKNTPERLEVSKFCKWDNKFYDISLIICLSNSPTYL